MPQFRDPNEKRDFMLNTPIPRLVPKMALPSIAGMLVTSAYNLADTLFVSQLGTDATGAVAVNGSIDLIIMMAGSLLAVGAASLTSRLLGAKQDERAREVLSTCFFLALALGTLVLILGFTYQNKILLLLGANRGDPAVFGAVLPVYPACRAVYGDKLCAQPMSARRGQRRFLHDRHGGGRGAQCGA